MQSARLAGFVGAVIAGALSGVVVTIVLRDPQRSPIEPQAHAAPEAASKRLPSSDPRVQKLAREQQLLAQRLAQLEDAGTDDRAGSREPNAEPLPDPVAERAAVIERHRQWRETHAAEAKDPAWAAAKNEKAAAELGQAAERNGFKFVGVDCRTTWCRAEFEWPSYADASRTYSAVLHSEMSGCQSGIYLEPPPDPTVPYRAPAMYDCTSDRAGPSE